MNTILIIVVQFAAAVILAALSAFLGIWLFERATRRIDEWQALLSGNAAVGLILASVVVGLAIVLQPTVAGALPDQAGRLSPDLAASALTALTLVILLIRSVVGLILGVVAILFAIWLFFRLTRQIDELAQIAEGNVAVAAVLAGVILAVALFVSPLVTAITDNLLLLVLP